APGAAQVFPPVGERESEGGPDGCAHAGSLAGGARPLPGSIGACRARWQRAWRLRMTGTRPLSRTLSRIIRPPNRAMSEDQTDFIALYSELGIEPDCSVDELRMAYRRRVADLHPDRGGVAGEDELKSLNLRYASALEFHRHYGRLPRAPPVPVARRLPDPADPVEAAQWSQEVPLSGPEARRPSKVVVYGIVLLAILLVWWLSRTDAGSTGIDGAGVAVNERERAPPTAT